MFKKALMLVISEVEACSRLERASVSVLLADDEELRALKNSYLALDQATNVLSFPSYESLDELASDPDGFLGDIAISYTRVYNESVEQGKSFEDHLMHMIIHSLLHLLGFDHIKPAEAELMEGIEVKLLAQLGINNPYILN